MAKEKTPKKKGPKSAAKTRATMYKLIGKMVSPEQAKVIEGNIAADSFGSAFLETSMDVIYGDIWARKGLTLKERSLVTLGALIALRANAQLDYQFKMALKNGLTPRQIEEVILQTFPYVGVTPVNEANAVAVKALESVGIKTKDRSSED